jgi:hypothetical protein
VAAAIAAIAAAALSRRLREPSKERLVAYQTALLAAAALVGAAGHLGGTLIWGAGFLHP